MVRENNVLFPFRAQHTARPSPSPLSRSTPADIAALLPKIVQYGLYATEMLCGSYGASHFINLLIVGMLM